MTIGKGSTLGPYEVLAHIGAGGMGDVWRARDKRIGRDVAIKVLADAFAPGDERVRRFEQEARAAGALNHPGLVTIFDVGTLDGAPYLVMELLQGQTLRDAIGEAPPQPLPMRRTLDYAIQIASALAVAHEKGIIHRDLKPENIFITADGLVKILDFGLAKLAIQSGDPAHRDRTARHLTSTGMVVGTPGYMSPEQVRAQPLDYRTDIFSLGAVLYEMVSGQRAFDRESAVETMHAVLSDEPPLLAETNGKVPVALDAIIAHCMEKSPRDRFQSARDLAFQLRMLLPDSQRSRTDALPAIEAKKKVPWAALSVIPAVLVLAGVGVAMFRGRLGARFHAVPRTYKQLTFADGVESFPTLAPDGKTFAYVSSLSGNRDIYVQRVDGRTAANITSDSTADDSEPAFSPDGSQIAFRSEREGGGIFVMGVTGESVKRLTEDGHNPAWSPDGKRIVYSTIATELQPNAHSQNGELWIVDAHSGEKRLLYRMPQSGNASANLPDALQPSWSPNGKRIAFWGVRDARRDIWTIDPNAADPARTLVRATSDPALHWNPVWSPDGRYLYFGSDAGGTLDLWRISVDEESGKALARPELMSLPAPVNAHFSFSHNGELVFVGVTRVYRLLSFPIGGGEPKTLFGGTQDIGSGEPSPNGQSVAFTTFGNQEDLFIANADGSHVRQLTNDPARDRGPDWSPDGKTLYFYSDRGGLYDIWSIRADGSGLARVAEGGPHPLYVPKISPDGKTVFATATRTAVLIHLDRPANQRVDVLNVLLKAPQWSPDGKRIAALASDGSLVVYSIDTRRTERILDHGIGAEWLPDGRHLVFFDKGVEKIVDLDTHRVTDGFTLPARQLAGRPHLSKDGSTVYALQTLEQGDVWLAHFNDE